MIGLGKMGLSHQAIINAHPEIRLSAICDSSAYILDILNKYTGVETYTDSAKMFEQEPLDAVFVATPSRFHAEIVERALDRGLHVFCEKPFVLDAATGYRLAALAESKGVVSQVGYHYRFVAAFAEARRLLDLGLIGKIHNVRAEAYGPVVLRPKGSTWRSQKSEGGGCLFDYACHAIDQLNFLFGRPQAVSGTVFNSIFSNGVDDEIYSTFHYDQGFSAQLAANWSDESFRKMSLKISIWGTNGRLVVDRQEIQVYLRKLEQPVENFTEGWNVRYTTELTPPVWFYMRGEEYSAQVDHFVRCIRDGATSASSFRSACDADLVAAMMQEDAERARTPIRLPATAGESGAAAETSASTGSSRNLLQRLFGSR